MQIDRQVEYGIVCDLHFHEERIVWLEPDLLHARLQAVEVVEAVEGLLDSLGQKNQKSGLCVATKKLWSYSSFALVHIYFAGNFVCILDQFIFRMS